MSDVVIEDYERAGVEEAEAGELNRRHKLLMQELVEARKESETQAERHRLLMQELVEAKKEIERLKDSKSEPSEPRRPTDFNIASHVGRSNLLQRRLLDQKRNESGMRSSSETNFANDVVVHVEKDYLINALLTTNDHDHMGHKFMLTQHIVEREAEDGSSIVYWKFQKDKKNFDALVQLRVLSEQEEEIRHQAHSFKGTAILEMNSVDESDLTADLDLILEQANSNRAFTTRLVLDVGLISIRPLSFGQSLLSMSAIVYFEGSSAAHAPGPVFDNISKYIAERFSDEIGVDEKKRQDFLANKVPSAPALTRSEKDLIDSSLLYEAELAHAPRVAGSVADNVEKFLFWDNKSGSYWGKTVAKVDCNYMQLFVRLWVVNTHERAKEFKRDNGNLPRYAFENIDGTRSLQYATSVKFPGTFQNRLFDSWITWDLREVDGRRQALIAMAPISEYGGTRKRIPDSEKLIEATSKAIWIISEVTENTCLWRRCQQVDLKTGVLPKKVLGYLATNQLDWTNEMQEFFSRNGKKVDGEVQKQLVENIIRNKGKPIPEDQKPLWLRCNSLKGTNESEWDPLKPGPKNPDVKMWIKFPKVAQGRRKSIVKDAKKKSGQERVATGKAIGYVDCTAEKLCAWMMDYNSNERSVPKALGTIQEAINELRQDEKVDKEELRAISKHLRTEGLKQVYSPEELALIGRIKARFGNLSEHSDGYTYKRLDSPDPFVKMMTWMDNSSESNDAIIGRATGVIDATLEDVAAFEMARMSRERLREHRDFGGLERSEKPLNDHTTIFYSSLDLKTPTVKEREFLNKIVWKYEDEDTLIVCYESYEDPEEYPVKYLRGDSTAKIVYKRLPELDNIPQTSMVYTVQVDMKGLIPKFIFNTRAVSFLSFVSNVRNLFSKSLRVDARWRNKYITTIQLAKVGGDGAKDALNLFDNMFNKTAASQRPRTSFPLANNWVRLDKASGRGWGTTTINVNATIEEVAAFIWDFASRSNYGISKDLSREVNSKNAAEGGDCLKQCVKRRIELRNVKKHNKLLAKERVFCNTMTLYTPDDESIIILLKPLFSDSPGSSFMANTNRALAGQTTVAYKLVRRGLKKTKLQVALELNFNARMSVIHKVPHYLVKSTVEKQLNDVAEISIYFQRLMPLSDYGLAEGEALGYDLMWNTGSSKKRVRRIRIVAKESLALRELIEGEDGYPWFPLLLETVTKGKLALNYSIHTKLECIVDAEATLLGKNLVPALKARKTAESGVNQWKDSNRPVMQLLDKHKWLEATFVVVSRSIVKAATWGVMWRVSVGAVFSVADLATDAYLAYNYYVSGEEFYVFFLYTITCIATTMSTVEQFMTAPTDAIRAGGIFRLSYHHWAKIENGVALWVRSNWDDWNENRPAWFTDDMRALIPADMVPTDADRRRILSLHEMKDAGEDMRRQLSMGRRNSGVGMLERFGFTSSSGRTSVAPELPAFRGGGTRGSTRGSTRGTTRFKIAEALLGLTSGRGGLSISFGGRARGGDDDDDDNFSDDHSSHRWGDDAIQSMRSSLGH
ncbi:hypothetical protein TrST_g4156 [Triparma strigata]|uniref:START domain-containing protein n=1 Tax=Triparma strigata TaxID=1606541 RepID=A0A9W6ZNQ0_9STRA|nr:hypothetical protein TrST_g4156 [Triparma strigata]